MKQYTPIATTLIALLIFFFFIPGQYENAKDLLVERDDYNVALKQAQDADGKPAGGRPAE